MVASCSGEKSGLSGSESYGCFQNPYLPSHTVHERMCLHEHCQSLSIFLPLTHIHSETCISIHVSRSGQSTYCDKNNFILGIFTIIIIKNTLTLLFSQKTSQTICHSPCNLMRHKTKGKLIKRTKGKKSGSHNSSNHYISFVITRRDGNN